MVAPRAKKLIAHPARMNPTGRTRARAIPGEDSRWDRFARSPVSSCRQQSNGCTSSPRTSGRRRRQRSARWGTGTSGAGPWTRVLPPIARHGHGKCPEPVVGNQTAARRVCQLWGGGEGKGRSARASRNLVQPVTAVVWSSHREVCPLSCHWRQSGQVPKHGCSLPGSS